MTRKQTLAGPWSRTRLKTSSRFSDVAQSGTILMLPSPAFSVTCCCSRTCAAPGYANLSTVSGGSASAADAGMEPTPPGIASKAATSHVDL